MTLAEQTQSSFYRDDWTIPMALDRAITLRQRPDAGFVFLRSDNTEEHYDYEELRQVVHDRARNMLAMGLKKGDRVGVIVPDPEDFVLTFLAAATAGIVTVPLYPPLGFGKLDSYIRDTARVLSIANVRMLLTAKNVQPVLWSLMGEVPSMERLVCVEKLKGQPAGQVEQFEDVAPDDVAFIQFTSGSTAAPKGVVVTHRSLGANCQTIMEHGIGLQHLDTDATLSWLPLYHDMGLIGMVLSPLAAGMHAVLVPTMTFIKRPVSWMRLMSKYKASISFAPNFAYGLSVKRTPEAKVSELDLSHVRVLGCGAEPNHPGTLRAFSEHFAPAGLNPEAVLPVYGMAEATLAMSFSRRDQTLRTDVVGAQTYSDTGLASSVDTEQSVGDDDKSLEFVSCGWALPGHRMRIVDADGEDLPDRQTGEIVFEGPSVTVGYFENPEATDRAFKTDGLRTGDLGYMVDGELFVTGRAKDLIILNGRNYDPHSIEWVVAEVDGVRKGNVICFSRPGEQSEELIVAAEVKRNSDVDAIRARIIERVREEFSLNTGDVCLLEPGTLPKTTSGKLQRAKGRTQYLAGQLGSDGVRTMGEKGQAIVLARHVARSMMSRVRHTVKRGLVSAVRTR